MSRAGKRALGWALVAGTAAMMIGRVLDLPGVREISNVVLLAAGAGVLPLVAGTLIVSMRFPWE